MWWVLFILVGVAALLALMWIGGGPVAIVQGFIKGKPVPVEVTPIGNSQTLRTDAAEAFLEMQADALRAGVVLKPNSGYRTNAAQALLYAAFQAGTGNLAAQPGWSNHQGGVSVDIDTRGKGFTSPQYVWLAANARDYGFINDVRTEAWHWTFQPAGEKAIS